MAINDNPRRVRPQAEVPRPRPYPGQRTGRRVAAGAAYPLPDDLRTEAASINESGERVYDVAYLLRLRTYMREALAAAEQASFGWNDLNEQYKTRYGADEGNLFIRKKAGHTNIVAAYDECVFHREWANMYANAIQAEMAMWGNVPRVNGPL